jgi:DNA-binding MarR family transcriptional regulator
MASGRAASRMASAVLNRYELDERDWVVLAALLRRNFLAPQQIARATMLDKVAMARASIRLGARGWVVRHPNRHDQRSHLLELTAAGEKVAIQALQAMETFNAGLFGGMPRAEMERLALLLERIELGASALKIHLRQARGRIAYL